MEDINDMQEIWQESSLNILKSGGEGDEQNIVIDGEHDCQPCLWRHSSLAPNRDHNSETRSKSEINESDWGKCSPC